MAALFAYLGTWLLSAVVALLAALQLGDHFLLGREFGALLIALLAFSFATSALFALAGAIARDTGAFRRLAFFLAAITLALTVWPPASSMIAGRPIDLAGLRAADIQLALTFAIPALVAVLIQWGLTRSRWLLARETPELSIWPWIVTVVAGVALLSPIGLTPLERAARQYPSGWLEDWTGLVAIVGIAMLVAMVLTECYIRTRMRRRRSGANS